MLPMHTRSHDPYQVGERFLVGFYGYGLNSKNYSHTMQAGELHIVTERDGESVHTIDDQGQSHHHVKRRDQDLEVGTCPDGKKRTVIWNMRLPILPADSIRIMADALNEYRQGPPLLLLCIENTEQGMVCERIHCSSLAGETRCGKPDEGRIEGNAFISKDRIVLAPNCDLNTEDNKSILITRTFPTIQPQLGDLLLLLNATYAPSEEPACIRRANVFRIATNQDASSVGQMLPESHTDTRLLFHPELNFATIEEVQDGIGRAYARLDPNDVLVVSIPDLHNPHDDVKVTAISHRGIRLYDSDNLDDDLWNMALEPGIWIGEDVTWFDCGDDGAEWEASWRRATSGDLASYGVDAEEIAEHWNDQDLCEATIEEIQAMIDNQSGPNPVEPAAHG